MLTVTISNIISAVVINPGFNYSVGNETYTVYQTMDFESITIDTSYIIFNNTGFYITSENDITITLVYISDDLTTTSDGEKVLEFYADTTSGSVLFSLSGFQDSNYYIIKSDGTSISIPIANSSGFISFSNSVWSSHLFEIYQIGSEVDNDPPVVSNIPDQTIQEGESFTQINLDNYVTDNEDSDENIIWTYNGNTELNIDITNRIATISTPNQDWFGTEIITFIATDSGLFSDSDDVTFTVIGENDPPVVSNIPDQTIQEGESFTQINLDNYVTDDEDSDENIIWIYTGNTQLSVDITNRIATITTPNEEWTGSETIMFIAEDTAQQTDSDDVTFTVNVQGAPVFSGLSINNGANDISINTPSLSITIEDPSGDLIDWTIEITPNIGSNSGSNDVNGTKSCDLSGLEYSTTYYWFVNATDSTNWANGSYYFTTQDSSSDNPPGGGGGPLSGGGYIPPSNQEEQNQPPQTPLKPSGPTYIETNITYTYTTTTTDPEQDQIRYKFDWGDGTKSNWTEYQNSNTTTTMTHHWTNINTYQIKAISQDTQGQNSTWSEPLTITVSQIPTGQQPPVAKINTPENIQTNQTITFNATQSYDLDGTIINYQWDFGDGTTGDGINPTHKYEKPGEYTVTLIITDNNGNTYSKTITVIVQSVISQQGSKEKQEGFFSIEFFILMVLFIIFIACCLYYLRDRLNIISLHYQIHKIEKIDVKIHQIENKIEGIPKVDQVTYVKSDRYINDTSGENIRGLKFTYQGNDSFYREDKYYDAYEDLITGEKIDKLLNMTLKSDQISIKHEKIKNRIDHLIIEHDKQIKIVDDADKSLKIHDLDKLKDIEGKIDNLTLLKMYDKIDAI